jgi:hypothetical protein
MNFITFKTEQYKTLDDKYILGKSKVGNRLISGELIIEGSHIKLIVINGISKLLILFLCLLTVADMVH